MSLTRCKRPVRRALDNTDMVRNGLVITIYPNGTLGLREQKRRKEFTLPASKVYAMAVRVTVEAEKAERRRARGLKPQVRRGLLR